MNYVPPEVFFLITKRLSIKNKFLLKAVCKKWHAFVISDILPRQHKLSIEKDYYSIFRCIDPDHQFQFRDNNSVPLLPVRTNRNRKRFFGKEMTGVKVLKFCGGTYADRVMKCYFSEGSTESLECLDIPYLEQPFVKVLPNLQHFSANDINLVSLISVLQYCPVLTHLSIGTKNFSDDLVDTFMNLPKGLQYLKLEGRSCDFLAIFCSPAMETLESLLLENWSSSEPFNKPDARVKPALSLRTFSMSSYISREQDRKMIIDLMKECPALKNIDLRVTGLTLEDNVNIYSQLSNLEMINLDLKFEFDDVIRMILWRNRKSLKYLQVGWFLLNLKSMKKLAEFPNLQTLSFSSNLVRILVLTDRILKNVLILFLCFYSLQLSIFLLLHKEDWTFGSLHCY